jgi:RNA polymerase sigma factor (TIGR02999 family)
MELSSQQRTVPRSGAGAGVEGGMEQQRSRDRDISGLLRAWSDGDSEAMDALIPLVYDELRRRARIRLAQVGGRALSTTSLVHETFLRLTEGSPATWQDRSHFFAVASVAMRHIIVDHARRRLARKRGGDHAHAELDESVLRIDVRAEELLAVDAALERLKNVDSRLGQLVELHFFGGLSFEEIAEAQAMSARTIRRDWRKARAFLHDVLGPASPSPPRNDYGPSALKDGA